MIHSFLFTTVIVACLVFWPAQLTDGLADRRPLKLLTTHTSQITVERPLAGERTPSMFPKVAQIVRPVTSPWDTPWNTLWDTPWDTPWNNHMPQKRKELALPTRLAAVEWRERLRQQLFYPNQKTAIGVHR